MHARRSPRPGRAADPAEELLNNFAKNLFIWVTIALMMVVLFNLFNQAPQPQTKLSYSEFIGKVQAGEVLSVKIQGQKITGTLGVDKRFSTYAPDDPSLVDTLIKNKVEVTAEPQEEAPWYMTLLVSWFPMLLLIGVWVFFMRQMQGGGSGGRGAMSFGRSRARLINEQSARVTFEDVAGVDEAKEELQEIVDFLRELV
jgi:cell division protease FtsH